ncbi:hypothetical protein F5888DRAFT_1887692 [Russula emetica]|nr:hypothetical protein F5888DRAFT_1887692 [Russula emetica]
MYKMLILSPRQRHAIDTFPQTSFILDYSRWPPSFFELYIHRNIQNGMFRWVYDLMNNSEGLVSLAPVVHRIIYPPEHSEWNVPFLEDHLRTTRGEDEASGDGEEEDEAWEGWEIGVAGKDYLDDDGSAGDVNLQASTLATTKILTPADFARLNDLRIQAASKAVENGGGSVARLNE